MTEKRFVRKGYKLWDTLEDEEVYTLHYRYEVDDMCDMMNDLIEEIEQLKKLLECSSKEANDYCEELMSKDEFIRLYKSQRDELKQFIKQNCPMCGANLELFYKEQGGL